MGVTLTPDTSETRKALNNLARHEFILKMYQNISMDIMVCDIEGWNRMEFIDMLYNVLSHFKKEASRGK